MACTAGGLGLRLTAGKHVLCEKPFTANAAEAREIADLAAKSDRVVMEAFHYRYHPLTLRIEQIIASGELGTLQRVEAALCFPLPKFSDIRYNYSLAGGAMMDRRMLCGPHGPHVRRFDPGSCFGTGENARFSGRPGHDGRVAVCGRAHRPGPLLDVVVRSAAVQRQGDWRPRRAAGAQSGDTAVSIGSRSDRPTASGASVSRAAPPTPISSTLSPRRCCVANR